MAHQKEKIATMEEFALVANVSRPSLSKYFRASDSVSERIRLRIEDALERFDYQPNIFAINQNRASSKTIGILVPYLADPFFAEMVRKIERFCIDAGYWPVLFSAHGKQSLENDALSTLRS
ncbi:MAG: LacI family DNA-binding transcriptional regulator, partial [Pseudomonadota bacterium]